MDEWILNLEHNCLDDLAQRAMINGSYSGWRPVTSAALHRFVMWPVLLNSITKGDRGHSHQVCRQHHSRGTSQNVWEQGCITGVSTQKGRNQEPYKIQQGKMQSPCILKSIILCSDTHWAQPGWGAALDKGVGCPGEKRAEPGPTVSPGHRDNQ